MKKPPTETNLRQGLLRGDLEQYSLTCELNLSHVYKSSLILSHDKTIIQVHTKSIKF